MGLGTRRRRTAEEARALILETAAQRLREFGLEGLNITGVADAAGISHATLIHHFGSSGEMRNALADKMTLDLIQDMVAALRKNVAPSEMIGNVFSALAEGGHAKLLAWRAVETQTKARDLSQVQALFNDLLEISQETLDYDEQELRNVIYLVATAAIGYGIAGSVLPQVLGMNEDDVEAFPQWVARHLS